MKSILYKTEEMQRTASAVFVCDARCMPLSTQRRILVATSGDADEEQLRVYQRRVVQLVACGTARGVWYSSWRVVCNPHHPLSIKTELKLCVVRITLVANSRRRLFQWFHCFNFFSQFFV
jgi:hypothetical protein